MFYQAKADGKIEYGNEPTTTNFGEQQEILKTAIISNGWEIKEEITTGKPYTIKVKKGEYEYKLSIYYWRISNGGKSRSATEKRIQIGTNIQFVDKESDNHKILLLGIYRNEENSIIVGWDVDENRNHGSSKSCQIDVSAIAKAMVIGFAKYEKSNGSIAYAFKPEFFYYYLNNIENLFEDEGIELSESYIEQTVLPEIDKDFNRIIFGAPGTGKSYKLKLESEGDGINIGCFKKQNIKRVTFHSNYSYFQFVGSYKPKPIYNKTVTSENNVSYMTDSVADCIEDYNSSADITYEFIPGPFLEVLVKAMVDYENGDSCNNYLLIIEEINRANVSGVFGDVFQLLDRDENGKSEYNIAVSDDMKVYLAKKGIKNPNELYIPPNFYIWCTMNSADQGVYPLDTAFKRRWNFEYIGIDENDYEIDKIKVTINGYGLCYWNKFRQVLNNHLVLEHNVKEDKLIGPFFIKKENLEEKKFEYVFINKLLMYLSEDVFKHNKGALFGENKTLTQIYKSFKDGDKIFDGLDENEFCVKNDTTENEEE
ncbi:AAA family ATPase [Peptostreptococcaceae bacterium AGR-M142]